MKLDRPVGPFPTARLFAHLFLPSATAIAAAAFALAGSPSTAAQPASVRVVVDALSVVAKVTPLSLGVNTAVWDNRLSDAAVPADLRAIGAGLLRYPGGSTSDDYHWQTNSAAAAHQKFSSDNDFDHFMVVAHHAHAGAIITVNYGSNFAGTGPAEPSEAAAWVAYANRTKHDNVKYWEIGNEVYGNGFYNGSGWEADLHAPVSTAGARKGDPRLSPSAYGHAVEEFSSAMKAEDPSVKIGVVLTTPGSWPDGVAPAWNPNVLRVCGMRVDFAIIHLYPQLPGRESDSGLLASAGEIHGCVAKLRPLLRQYCGRQIPIFVTETNSVASNPGKQTVSVVNALFAADSVLTWLENGVANVDWWDLHDGPNVGNNNSPSLDGSANYGDYGLLSNGASPEPSADTPQPTYFGLEMAYDLAAPGDALVLASSNQPLLAVHAARGSDGRIGIMVINKSPRSSYAVHMLVRGASTSSKAVRLDFGQDGEIRRSSVHASRGALEVDVPPYTICDLILQGTH